MAFSWNDENVEKLKKMWAKGMSARQIGDELGGISRNSVIGKVHRLGLSAQKEKETNKTPKKPKVTVQQTASKVIKEPIQIATYTTKNNEKVCQWPFGDPGTAEFKFCQKTAVVGRPYCAEHCELAYRKNTD